MQRFFLNRVEDETGISGTGIITEGYIYDSGVCVMKWLTDKSSVAVYASKEDVVAIHGHQGKTQLQLAEDGLRWSDLPLWAIDPVGYYSGRLGNPS